MKTDIDPGAMFDRIPGDLTARRQFVATKIVYNPADPNAKPKKPPINVHTGGGASTTNPDTWATFEKTVDYVAEWHGSFEHRHFDKEHGEMAGDIVCPGFVLAKDDPFCFVDLDHCVDDAGTVAPWALEVVEALNSYTEISLSGQGLHVIIRGNKPAGSCRKKIGDHGGEIEIYNHGRYVALTGNVLDDLGGIHDRQTELDRLYERIFSSDNKGAGRTFHGGDAADPSVTAEVVLGRAMRSKQAERLKVLLDGDDSGNGNDTSAADQAACNIIAFYCGYIPDGQAETIIDKIIRESKRHRPKWDQLRGDKTYGSITIREALAKTNARYMTRQERAMQETSDAGDLMDRLGLSVDDIVNAAHSGQKGVADLYSTFYRGRFCFDHAEGEWSQYTGHHWKLDKSGAHIRAVDAVQDAFKRADAELNSQIILVGVEAASAREKEEQDELQLKLNKLEGQRKTVKGIINNLNYLYWRKQACEFSAQGPGSLGIAGDEWDTHPWLFPCANGVVDLKTGKLSTGCYTDYLRAACPTAYNPSAKCPNFERVLSEIFNGNENLIGFIRRFFGMSIVGTNAEHAIGILYGAQGRNGKDTILEVLGDVLGEDLAGAVKSELLMEQRSTNSSGPSADIMRLRGLRLVWASETNEGRRMDAGRVKMLSGGGAMVGRSPHAKREVSFKQSFTISLLTNSKPRVPADDCALWERLKLIPFEMRFVDDPREQNEKKRDKFLKEKLKAEADGILTWLVSGCLEWQRVGLLPPQEVVAATAEYRNEEDIVLQFIGERCVTGLTAEVRAGELYQSYKEWAQESGLRPMSSTMFGKKVGARFERVHRMYGWVYQGVGIRAVEGYGQCA